MEVPDREVLLLAFLFEGDVSISHCPAPGSPASLCGEGKEYLFSYVYRSANPSPDPVVEIPGYIGSYRYPVRLRNPQWTLH
jgi:hypothetical protein